MSKIDVTQVGGPHSPAKTDAAARLIADAVRYLNYATLPSSNAPGISYAGDVDGVIGSIHAAVDVLRQTFGQLAECLRDDLATGRLRLAPGGVRDRMDTENAVEVACGYLEAARAQAETLGATLGHVRHLTSAMYLEPEEGR